MAIFTVQTGKTFGFVPHAHICDGSVVKVTVLGWSTAHATRRAQKVIAAKKW